jgi:prepilin-type N-terminal cleavage/methylation domain-containing protein
MRKKGLTLIEVLVALIVVSVALGAVFGTFASSVRGNRVANVETQAQHFVENLLELYRLRWTSPAHYKSARDPTRGDVRRISAHLPRGVRVDVQKVALGLDGRAWTGTGTPPLREVRVSVFDQDGRLLASGKALIPDPNLDRALKDGRG